MSWLDESFTEVDSAKNELKDIRNTISPKWYEDFPSNDTGYEGEVRYVYSRGKAFMCVKMSENWHFSTLQTLGQNGVYRSDSGELTGSVFDESIGYTPNYDSGWRQIHGNPSNEPGWESLAPSVSGQSEIGGFVGSGPIFQCIGYRTIFHYDGLFAEEVRYPVFLVNHGLGFSRPPSNVVAYICSSPPVASWNIDYVGSEISTEVNAIQNPPSSDNMMSDIYSLLDLYPINHTNHVIKCDVSGYAGNCNSSQWPWSASSFPDEFRVNMNFISANHLIFSPTWRITASGQTGSDGEWNLWNSSAGNFEWLRIYIWR